MRKVRALVREMLKDLSRSFSRVYSHEGRPSIPPEQLLSALLLQVLYGIRSERLPIEQLELLVRFGNNKYSVTANAVGRPIEIHAYADRIVIRQDGRIVAEHRRSFGRGETVYDPWHYVPVLARKPGALRNGAPFKDWVLPAAMERVRRKLAGADDGNRQMVDILAAVLTDGLTAVEAACAEALTHSVHSAERSHPAGHHPHTRRADPAPSAARRLCPLRQPQENRLMERTQLFDLMGELKLYGMKAAFDEIMATAVKRQHEPQRIVGDLLTAEVSEKQARSIRYQLTIAKLPLAKDLDDFEFAGTPINQTLVHDLAGVPSSPSSATPCWSAVPAPARPTWPSPLPEAASAAALAAGSTTSSISSTRSRPRPATAGRAGLPIT